MNTDPSAFTPPTAKSDNNIGQLIGNVRGKLMSALDTALQKLELTGTQLVIIKQIAQGHSQTAADLCRVLSYDTGAMTRVLDKLEQSNWIYRQRSTQDRRIVRLHIAEYGYTQLPELYAIGARVINQHLRGFTDAEQGQLKSYLLRMIENANTSS